MPKNIFKYPGAKTQMSGWIIDQFPTHRTYVEVFGGSAAVLANKDESKVEVLNDIDGDIVHFFETLRDRGDELRDWLAQTPHSRELHDNYATEFYNGARPNDDIERAGRFFYLRETQFAQKYTKKSGYSYQKKRNGARAMHTKVDRLSEWQERFRNVQIEQLDCIELINRYDSEKTFFYADPPYVEEGDALYSHDGFDHQEFSETLAATDGLWCVSYTDVPPTLQDAADVILSQERKVSMRKGQGDWEKTNTERLVMNYDPDKVDRFAGEDQQSLADY
jgi:DNA adenine methylase